MCTVPIFIILIGLLVDARAETADQVEHHAEHDETVLKGVNTLPLFAGVAGLGALLLAFSALWWREGR